MNSNLPLVSVVISVFNGERYILEALSSIVEQTYKKLEIIVIDDGSTDSTLEIIKGVEDERIILVSRENKGLIFSLNEGIKLASGKYIARMDADDISIDSRISEQVKFLEENPDIGVVGAFAKVFGEGVKEKIFKQPCLHDEIISKMYIDSPFIHPSVMLRRDLLINNNLFYDFEYYRVEDFALWVKLSKITTLANIPRVLLRYRYLESSETRLSQNDITVRTKVLEKVFELYLNRINTIGLCDEEVSLYTKSMMRANFKEINVKKLNLVYNKVTNVNNNFYLKMNLGYRWLGLFFVVKKNIVKNPFLLITSKNSYYGLLAVLKKINVVK
ncbi:glycosyltransferase family 2 protein [Myroides odoratimimus]|uniref:glycosyltransferase family 2 protein n=1 Tax=Myroides odoratimimus TaxID=76832 RepID=UPI0038D48A31